jgi:hypothetical protein
VPHDCADGFLAAYWRRPGSLSELDLGYRLVVAGG